MHSALAIPILAAGLLSSQLSLAASEKDGTPAAASSRPQSNAETIAQLKELEARQPGAKGLQRKLGIAYYREGEYLEAAKYLERAWKENAEDRDAVQLLGLSYYSSGRPAEAIPALEKVRAWHPDQNIDAIYILGLCYIMAKRYDRARQTFAQLYGVPADSAAAHLVLGRMLLRQGFDPVAERELKAALSIEPRLPLAHFSLGDFAVYKGDYAAAIQQFNAELSLNPACAPALTHLGDAYWRLNRDDDAQNVLQRSINVESTASEPYATLGKVLLRRGNADAAEENLLRAIALDRGNYSAHYFLGQLYQRQGKAEAAERELKTAARIQQQALTAARN